MPEMKPRTKAPKEEQLNEPLDGEMAAYDEVGLFRRSVSDNTAYRYHGVLLLDLPPENESSYNVRLESKKGTILLLCKPARYRKWYNLRRQAIKAAAIVRCGSFFTPSTCFSAAKTKCYNTIRL